jgi:hypothetical protein
VPLTRYGQSALVSSLCAAVILALATQRAPVQPAVRHLDTASVERISDPAVFNSS